MSRRRSTSGTVSFVSSADTPTDVLSEISQRALDGLRPQLARLVIDAYFDVQPPEGLSDRVDALVRIGSRQERSLWDRLVREDPRAGICLDPRSDESFALFRDLASFSIDASAWTGGPSFAQVYESVDSARPLALLLSQEDLQQLREGLNEAGMYWLNFGLRA